MVAPQRQCRFDFALIRAFVVDTSNSGAVAGLMIEDLFDDVRCGAQIAESRCECSAKVVQSPCACTLIAEPRIERGLCGAPSQGKPAVLRDRRKGYSGLPREARP